MPAIAALINKAVPGDKSIKLFYNTGNAQLALCLRSGTQDDDPDEETWAEGNGDLDRYIMNPSQMACAAFRDLDYVVAVTTPKPGQEATGNQISLVSPVYQELQGTDRGNNTLAMCSSDSGTEGWVYFTKQVQQTTRVIEELNLVSGEVSELISTSSAWINTSLVAWYDLETKARHVIFEASSLMEYNVNDQQLGFVGTVGDMQRNTPLALSYWDKKTYLYYCARGKQGVQRVVKEAGIWGQPKAVPDSPDVAESSQMAVVAANGFNHLFYVAKDEEVMRGPGASDKYFQHIRDPLQ